MEEARAWIETLRSIYTDVRLLDADTVNRIEEGSCTDPTEDKCYADRHRQHYSRNCAAKLALSTKSKQCRIEIFGDELAHITACYYEIEGRPYVLELVQSSPCQATLDTDTGERVLRELSSYNNALYQDVLTGVYNRRYYDERLKNLEGRFSFAMIDMDNFKRINDQFGHQAGDAALYRAAQAIKSQIRSDDELVRYGGDEFFLLFRNLPQQILEKKLQSIRACLDEIVIEEYPELHISASIGGAFAAGRISETIRRADLAMYQAKLKKDCVAIYREEKEHET